MTGQFTGDITHTFTEAQTEVDGSVTETTTDSAKPLKNLTVCVTEITDGVSSRNLQPYSNPDGFCSSL